MSKEREDDGRVTQSLAQLGRMTDGLRPSTAQITRMLSEAKTEADRRTTLPSAIWHLRRPALVILTAVVAISGVVAWRAETQQALTAGSAIFAWSEL